MVKYVLINYIPKKEDLLFPEYKKERVLFEDSIGRGIIYICEKCFREFKSNACDHLVKCDLYFPFENAVLCYFVDKPYPLKIFEISKKTVYNNRLANIISRMSWFSKSEQEIGLPIVNKGLLGEKISTKETVIEFIFYILFRYKNIIGYCLVQRRRNFLKDITNVIVRDIYILPQYRGNNYSIELLKKVSLRNRVILGNIIFSAPVSENLKKTLKKNYFQDIITIDGENVNSLQRIDL